MPSDWVDLIGRACLALFLMYELEKGQRAVQG